MWSKLKAARISAFGLSGLQAGTQKQIDDAKVLIARRQSESAALIERAENLRATADTLRQEAYVLTHEADRAEKWVAKLEKTLA